MTLTATFADYSVSQGFGAFSQGLGAFGPES